MPTALKTYIASIAAATGLICAWMVYSGSYPIPWQALIFFSLLVWLAENFCIDLGKAGAVSISFTVILAATVLFGPTLAAISALFTAFIWRDMKKGTKPIRWLFNGSQIALAAIVAGLSYVGAGGLILTQEGHGFILADFPFMFLPIALAIVTFYLANTILVSIAIGLSEGMRPLDVWLLNIRWTIPNFLTLAPLGIAIAQIFMAAGYIGVILMFLPLIVARQAFQVYVRLQSTYMGTIQSLIAALEAKDPYTRGHSERVATFAERTGRELKLGEDDLETLSYAGTLHDIGKIGTSRYILRKPGRLNDDERRRIQCHPEAGALILREVSFLDKVVPIIFHHHERFDGNGYADGIGGNEIPLLARILTVADSYDAMTSPRPYRTQLPKEAACQELIDCSGTHFDPTVVQAFLRTINYTPDKHKVAEGQLQLSEIGT
jgi:putative nucleotidyltransferase with HDIG domain